MSDAASAVATRCVLWTAFRAESDRMFANVAFALGVNPGPKRPSVICVNYARRRLRGREGTPVVAKTRNAVCLRIDVDHLVAYREKHPRRSQLFGAFGQVLVGAVRGLV